MSEKSIRVLAYLEDVFVQYEHAGIMLSAANQKITKNEKHLKLTIKQLRASNQKLQASELQLKMSNQQLLTQTQELSRMATVVKDSNDAVTIQDLCGNITAWNAGATKTYGYNEQEAFKMNMADLVPEEFKSEALNFITDLKNGELVDSLETQRQTKDGKILDVWIVVTKLVDKDGELIGVATTERDITERKKAEGHETLIAQLQDKTAEQERFIYTVSHDLKSPLVNISGFSDLAEKDLNSGDQVSAKNDLAIIKQSALRMRRLLDELLEVSRVGIKKNQEEVVNLNTLITEGTNNLSELIKECNTKLEVEPDLPDVRVDKQRFLQVIENLVANASRYSRSASDGSNVKVGVIRNDEELICYIKDNGIGIESQYLEKVFGLFERLDTNTDGTGVGLTIVKRIIQNHGGRIWAESEGLGHGTTFFFTLPEA